MAKYDSYIICTSPRSGSTLLCKLLLASGAAGNPDSYFHKPSVSAWLRALNLIPDDSIPERAVLAKLFESVIVMGSGNTNLFGLRLQRKSFDYFAMQLEVLHPGLSSDSLRLQEVFGKICYIHLVRNNKVDQAVSLLKAEQTGLWHLASDGTEFERLSAPRPPVYDSTEIANRIAEATTDDHEWNTWFANEGINPLQVEYEELSENPIETLSVVLKHLGVSSKAAIGVEPMVAKMADRTSREWVERYRTEFPE